MVDSKPYNWFTDALCRLLGLNFKGLEGIALGGLVCRERLGLHAKDTDTVVAQTRLLHKVVAQTRLGMKDRPKRFIANA